MRKKNFLVLFTVFSPVFIFSLTTSAQIKTESVVSSNIVRVWLPSGAEKVLPEFYPAEMTEMLAKVVAGKGQGKRKRYDSEVLFWKGADFKKTGADAIIGRLTERIKAAEWQYKAGKTESGLTILPFRKTRPETLWSAFISRPRTACFGRGRWLRSNKSVDGAKNSKLIGGFGKPSIILPADVL